MSQTQPATKDDARRLDRRVDRVEDKLDGLAGKVDRGFAGLNRRIDRLQGQQSLLAVALVAALAAIQRWL